VQGGTDDENAKLLKAMLEKAETWRIRHGARFEPSKYMLVYFTRNNKCKMTATITISGTTIQLAGQARYLGVFFNKGLR
jgi:hypothetical protein